MTQRYQRPSDAGTGAPETPAFFPRFASRPLNARSGPRPAGIFAARTTHVRPHQWFPLDAPAKESLGAARASRADGCLARDPRRATPSRGRFHVRDLARSARGQVASQGGVLLVSAPRATQSWVAKRFGRLLETCARTVLGDRRPGAIEGSEAAPDARSRARGRGQAARSAAQEPPASRSTRDSRSSSSSSATATAWPTPPRSRSPSFPGQAYNPLFLHAPPGLGKTHLLHAIGNYVRAFGGGASVRYTTVEAFTNHFITALSSRSLDHFKHAYRDADVLLIDDVQFLASKAKTEEEFFHTFNAAVRDRPPAGAHLRPAAAPARRRRGAPARALRGRARGR